MAHSHNGTPQLICPACNYGPFTRNNYFTGKLLVERDFTDETHFHMEKLRHHEQQLHGWGVVCGLKVKPHPTEVCRDRFVCIEPGSAVDCCGHDIIVSEERCVDITRLPEIKALKDKNDKDPHKLQICLRFRECPTEDIPVLYDDCGCDDTKCAPNRILESYDIGVKLDQKHDPEPFHVPKLKWENSIGVAHAAQVALHDASHRLYVLTADNPATVYQISTDNHATIKSRTLLAKVVAQAISNDGKHLYVVVEPAVPAMLRQLHVLDTTQPGMPDFNTNPFDLPNSSGSDVALAVAPDGRLLTLVSSSGDVLRWPADLDTNAAPAAPSVVKNLGAGLAGLTLSSDGKLAFMLGSGNQIQALDLTAATVTPIGVLPAAAKPSSMALVSSTAPDMLAVADQTNMFLHLVQLPPSTALIGSVKLGHPPVGLVAAPGGHWAYLLERDTDSFIQSVSLDALVQHLALTPGAGFKIGDDSRQIVMTASGKRLYVPYVDDIAQPVAGGVAIVEVSEASCAEILWRHLDGCPHCDVPDCVVLATIENYHLGDRIEEQTDPPGDPAQDATDKVARIDNRKGRRLLPSTEVLTELVECLLEHGTGTGGAQGPQGPSGLPGPNGLGIDAVKATIVDCNQPGSAQIQMIAGVRTLVLEIPRGCDAQLPAPLKLPRIVAINWPHNGVIKIDSPEWRVLNQTGLVVAFQTDRPVFAETLTVNSFQLLRQQQDRQDEKLDILCYCNVRGRVTGVNWKASCQEKGEIPEEDVVAGPVTGGRFRAVRVDGEGKEHQVVLPQGNYRVVIEGDFILGSDKIPIPNPNDSTKKIDVHPAMDGNHLGPGLLGPGSTPIASLPARCPTGNVTEGGTFESWFTIA